MTLNKIREKINLKIYSSKSLVLKIFRVLSVLVASVVVASLIYYHGFFSTHEENAVITEIIKWGFGFYILKYLVRLFFSFQPVKDFKASALEGTLMLIVLLNFLFVKFFGWQMIHSIGMLLDLENLDQFFALVIQAYFVLILINEIGRAGNLISSFELSPPALLISSFLILIATGTGILSLPTMTSAGVSMPFLDALFTSISASCVTGLIVVDTATYFSFKGQFVIMMLIQLGGLNIISFASAFTIFARQGIGLKHQGILQENMNVESLSASSSLFRQIFIFSMSIELIGAILIFFTWDDSAGLYSLREKVFFSVFHSISAFNNAGFSLFTNGLFEHGVNRSYSLHLVIAVLIFLGGIGFAVMRDVFSFTKNRERRDRSWKGLKIDSKIALYSAAALIISGFLVFMIFEQHNTLEGKSAFGKFTTALFQSITARTAGFNTVDIGAVTTPVLIFVIFLMFIGASPGSTGGGIKTNTFAMVLLGAWSTATGRERLELFRHTIPFDLLNKAFLIFLFSIAFISLGIFGLAITEPDKDLISLSFEEVSAYCTVGLSTGITPDLSTPGRIIVMLSMFLGRIGTLSLAFALGRKRRSCDYKYPKANIMVG